MPHKTQTRDEITKSTRQKMYEQLAACYEKGEQLSESERECVRKHYVYLAAHKNIEAIYKLGLYHLKEMQDQEEGSAAYLKAKNAVLSNFRWAAKEAHPDANQQLGEWYRTGTLVEKNRELSMKYYEEAAHLISRQLAAVSHGKAEVTVATIGVDIPLSAEKIKTLLPENNRVAIQKEREDCITKLKKCARIYFILGSMYETILEEAHVFISRSHYERAAILYARLERIEEAIKKEEKSEEVDMAERRTVSVQHPQKSYQALYNAAKAEYEEKLAYINAMEAIPRKLQIDPLSAQAHYAIGRLYRNGNGNEKISVDLKKAFQHCKIAVAQGGTAAGYEIALIYDQNTPEVPCDPQQLILYVEMSAEKGNLDAQHFLGNCYGVGKYVAQDVALSHAYYKKAAAAGHAISQYEMGVQYEKEGDFKAAFDSYLSASCLPQSCFALGGCYEEGKGAEIDMQKAIHFYKLAALNGEVRAMLYLWKLYLQGKGKVAKNFKQALFYINQAAEKGAVSALYYLAFYYMHGYGLEKNPEKALDLLGQAERVGYLPPVELMSFIRRQLGEADRGTAERKAKIFQLLAKKEIWPEENEAPAHRTLRLHTYYLIEKDFQAFIAYTEFMAAQSNQAFIGILRALHLAGKHVAQDPQLVAYYEDPTVPQNTTSLYYIGEYYCLAQDIKEAVRWYKEAAILGYAWALLRLEEMQLEGKYPVHEEVDFPHLRSIVSQTADIDGLLNLARFYAKSVQREENILTFTLFKRAKDLGSIEGTYRVGLCYLVGRGTEKNKLLALDLYKEAAEKGHSKAAYTLAADLIFSANEILAEKGMFYLELAEKNKSPDAIQVMSAARVKLGDRERNTPEGKAAFLHILLQEVTWPYFERNSPQAQAMQNSISGPAQIPAEKTPPQEEKEIPVSIPASAAQTASVQDCYPVSAVVVNVVKNTEATTASPQRRTNASSAIESQPSHVPHLSVFSVLSSATVKSGKTRDLSPT